MSSSALRLEVPWPLASMPRSLACLRLVAGIALTLLFSALLVFAVELIVRGSFAQTLHFFQQPFRPGWTTIVLFALLIVFFDGLLGRNHQALLIVGPVALILAFVGHQKAFYLGDPLYPTDFLYARQIVELMPLLVRQRPMDAVLYTLAGLALAALLVVAWRHRKRKARRLSWGQRCMRLVLALPALAFFGSIMDYATFSWARDRLQIFPVMWDQKENYNSNGFAIAFALNVPMAKVGAPAGYTQAALATIGKAPVAPLTIPADKPDYIVIMSESFWDPTLLPKVKFETDPIPTVRALSTGSVFSPEFGGMTSNVEFEALTGFSNAFLPYGSIPYQQYIRTPMPSLAKFLRSEGYETTAFHPFAGWFWNRSSVYSAFGFERFLSDEVMPPIGKRGPLAADTAFTEEIIREADGMSAPFFFFAVTLQGHGPYEANRYPDSTLKMDAPFASAPSLKTYATGVVDADKSLAALIDWARKRERHTIIAFFGDHLPPLGPVYTETGFMPKFVADRTAPLPELAIQHRTPLVLWSNRSGRIEDVGAISPAFLPMHLLKTGGFSHPYYTGFLGQVHDRYHVVDRNMLVSADGTGTREWSRMKQVDPLVRDYRLLQYDVMFGKRFGEPTFFPLGDAGT